MISELTQYGAVSAKVHGMYGKRLKPEDYDQLMSMTSVEEIMRFLRSRQDWSHALSYLEDGVPITRARLETALRLQYLEDYTKLFAFVGRDDRELMRFPIYRMELAEILSALRRMHARNPLQVLPAVPEFYRAHSHVDFEKLRLSSNLEELSASVSGSIFAEPIAHLLRSGQDGSEFTAIEVLLQSTYYGRLFRQLRTYKGAGGDQMKKYLTQETDMLNIIHFLRLKRYFSYEDVQRYAFPYSFSHRLKKEFIHQLLSAPDYDAAISLLRTSCYGSLFRGGDDQIETYYDQLLYRYNHAQLRRGTPSIYTPIAYLMLKEFELNNLISILECVRYGVDPRRTAVRLVGVYN